MDITREKLEAAISDIGRMMEEPLDTTKLTDKEVRDTLIADATTLKIDDDLSNSTWELLNYLEIGPRHKIIKKEKKVTKPTKKAGTKKAPTKKGAPEKATAKREEKEVEVKNNLAEKVAERKEEKDIPKKAGGKKKVVKKTNAAKKTPAAKKAPAKEKYHRYCAVVDALKGMGNKEFSMKDLVASADAIFVKKGGDSNLGTTGAMTRYLITGLLGFNVFVHSDGKYKKA